MANGNQLIVNMKFQADIRQAEQDMKRLQNQLTDIMRTTTSSSTNPAGILTKDLHNAQQAAASLKVLLNNAFNVNTGKLNLNKFSQELKKSGMTLSQYRQALYAIGPEGQVAFNQVAQSIMTAETAVFNLNKGLSNLVRTFANTARYQLSTSLITGFTSAIRDGVKFAEDLNESLTNIRIVTGKNADEMARFAEKANKVAKLLHTTTIEYTDAALIYFQQGLSMEEVEKRTAVTVKMAQVTKQSMEETSNQLTAVWNNFYDGSKSLEYYADVITALGAATASSSSEITQGLEKFAGVAETVGLSYEYATAALATVTATTRESADVVGTAFKTLFARLQDLKLGDTLDDGTTLGKYSEALAAVGVEIKNTDGTLRDMDQILDDLAKKWDTLGKAEQTALAKTVAGVRQYTQLVTLMNNWDVMQANLVTAQNSTGALEDQVQSYAESWEAAKDKVTASLETIYQELLDDKGFIKALNFLSEFIDSIGHVVKGLGGLQGLLVTIGSLISTVFSSQLSSGIMSVANTLTFASYREGKRLKEEVANSVAPLAPNASTDIKAAATADTIRGDVNKAYLDMSVNMNDTQRQIAEQYQKQVNYMADLVVKAGEAANEEERRLAIVKHMTEAEARKAQGENYTYTSDEKKALIEAGFAKEEDFSEQPQLKQTDNIIHFPGHSVPNVSGYTMDKEAQATMMGNIRQSIQEKARAGAYMAQLYGSIMPENIQTIIAKNGTTEQSLPALEQAYGMVSHIDENEVIDNAGAEGVQLVQQLKTALEEIIAKIKNPEQNKPVIPIEKKLADAESSADWVPGKNELHDMRNSRKVMQANQELINQYQNDQESQEYQDAEYNYNIAKNNYNTRFNELLDRTDWKINNESLEEYFKATDFKVSEDGPSFNEQLTQYAEQVEKSANKAEKPMEKLTQAQKEWDDTAANNTQTATDLSETFTALGGSGEQLVEQSAATGREMANLSAETSQAKITAEKAKISFQQFASSSSQVLESGIALVSTLSSLAMAFQMVKNLGSIWTDDDLTLGEKMLTTLTTIGSILPILTTALNANNIAKITGLTIDKGSIAVNKTSIVGKLANAAATKMLTLAKNAETGSVWANTAAWLANPIMWVALIIAGVVAAMVALVAIIKVVSDCINANTTALEKNIKKQEAQRKTVEEANESLKQANEHLDKMKELMEEINSIQNAFENLSKGSAEWQENLQKNNDTIRELLNLYPELMDMKLVGFKDGILQVLNQEAVSAYVLRGAQLAQNQALFNSFLAQSKLDTTEIDVNFGRKYEELANDQQANKITDFSQIVQNTGDGYIIGGSTAIITKAVPGSQTREEPGGTGLTKDRIEWATKQIYDGILEGEGQTYESIMNDIIIPNLQKSYSGDALDNLIAQFDEVFATTQLLDGAMQDEIRARQELNEAIYASALATSQSMLSGWSDYQNLNSFQQEYATKAYANAIIEATENAYEYTGAYNAADNQGVTQDDLDFLAKTYLGKNESSQKVGLALNILEGQEQWDKESDGWFTEIGSSALALLGGSAVLPGIGTLTATGYSLWDQITPLWNQITSGYDTIIKNDRGDYGDYFAYSDEGKEVFNAYLKKYGSTIPGLSENADWNDFTFDEASATFGNIKILYEDILSNATMEQSQEIEKILEEASNIESGTSKLLTDNVSAMSEEEYNAVKTIIEGENQDAKDALLAQAEAVGKSWEEISRAVSEAWDEDAYLAYMALQDELKAEEIIATSAEQYGLDAEALEIYAKNLSSVYDISYEQAAQAAISNARYTKGIENLSKALSDSGEALQNWIDTGEMTYETSQALAEITSALVDVFGVEVSPKFIATYLKDIQKLLDGGAEAEEALKKLELAAAQDYVANLSIKEDYKSELDSMLSYLQELELKTDFTIGFNGDISKFQDTLQTLLNEGLMTVDEMNAMFATIGWAPDIEEVQSDPQILSTTWTKTGSYDGYNGNLKEGTENWEKVETWGTVTAFTVGDHAVSMPRTSPTITKPPISPSGGGGSSKSKNLDAETERYHHIKQTISDLSREYDMLSKAKDRAFGQDRLNYIDAEIAKTKELKEAQKTYLEEIEANLEKDREALIKYGASFDEYGRITNYEDLIAVNVDAYNAGRLDDEGYDLFKSELDQYEETRDLLFEEQQTLIDLENQAFDALLEKTKYVVELGLSLVEDQLTLIDYQLNKIEDDAYDAAEALGLLSQKMAQTQQNGNFYRAGIEGLLDASGLSLEDILNATPDQLQEMIANSTFTEEQIDLLREYRDGLLECNEQMKELADETLERVISAFDAWNEKLDKGADKIEHLSSMVQNYRDIIDLVGKDTLGISDDMLETLNRVSVETSQASLSAAKTQLEANKQALLSAREELARAESEEEQKYWSKVIDDLEDRVREGEEEVMGAWQNALQVAADAFEDSLERISSVFEDAVAGMYESLKSLQSAYDQQMSIKDRYLADYAKIYELSKLTRDITNSIDESDSVRAKSKLRDLQEEIYALQASGAEMTEYEVNELRARYELRLAEIALEEAQNAKSQVRMSRDSEGNWSYVYTADEEATSKAEQNYEDALYNYQNLTQERMKNLESQLLALPSQASQAMKELEKNTSLSNVEKTQRKQELTEFYSSQYQYILQQMGVSNEDARRLYNEDWMQYAQFNDYKISSADKWIDSFDETVYAQLTGFTTIEEAQQNFEGALTSFVDNATASYNRWQNQIAITMQLAGSSVDSFASDLTSAIKQIEQDSKTYQEEIEEISKDMDENVSDMFGKAKDIWEKYGEFVSNGATANEKLADALNDVVYYAAGASSAIEGITRQYYWLEQQAKEAASAMSGVGSGAAYFGGATVFTAKGIAANTSRESTSKAFSTNFSSSEKKQYYWTEYGAEGSGKWLVVDAAASTPLMIVDTQTKNELAIAGMLNREAWRDLTGFDTGGYTGSWDSSGRLAMLHQKEIVLNAHDTENFLSAIHIIRDIAKTIDLNAAAQSGLFSLMNSLSVAPSTQTIEQEVTIHAEFPNATNHNEIEEAFNSLINRASQFANRKN